MEKTILKELKIECPFPEVMDAKGEINNLYLHAFSKEGQV